MSDLNNLPQSPYSNEPCGDPRVEQLVAFMRHRADNIGIPKYGGPVSESKSSMPLHYAMENADGAIYGLEMHDRMLKSLALIERLKAESAALKSTSLNVVNAFRAGCGLATFADKINQLEELLK